MPCNSDYMNPGSYEIEISRIACLLDELDGKPGINKSHWGGYHPRAYGVATKKLGDKIIDELCTRLSKIDVTKYSLEMQMWWRDHQEIDRQRGESQ